MRADIYSSPADDPEALKFINKIAETRDPLHRMIFADWLDENGYSNAAHGQRWAAKYNKAPRAATEMQGIGPSTQLEHGGWHTVTGGLSDAHKKTPDALPYEFLFGVNAKGERQKPFSENLERAHPVLTRSARMGTALNEGDFLHATHQMNWDENGEPLKKYEQ